jgi:hypothetical protein
LRRLHNSVGKRDNTIAHQKPVETIRIIPYLFMNRNRGYY